MAETKKDALLAFDAFIETWGVKYDRATECLIKDRDALLAFYDFPAEHWKHLAFCFHLFANRFPTWLRVTADPGACSATVTFGVDGAAHPRSFLSPFGFWGAPGPPGGRAPSR